MGQICVDMGPYDRNVGLPFCITEVQGTRDRPAKPFPTSWALVGNSSQLDLTSWEQHRMLSTNSDLSSMLLIIWDLQGTGAVERGRKYAFLVFGLHSQGWFLFSELCPGISGPRQEKGAIVYHRNSIWSVHWVRFDLASTNIRFQQEGLGLILGCQRELSHL